MSISGGGQVSSLNSNVGTAPGAPGTVTISGAGSQWNNSGQLFIGTSGSSGTLTVQSGAAFSTEGSLNVGDGGNGVLSVTGGEVSDANATVGAAPGSSGSVLVDGGDWISSGLLDIGVVGAGSVYIENGGQLTAGTTTVGGQGSLTVDPSSININGDFILLSGGILSLDIGGSAPGLYSQLDISGTGTFQGTVVLDFINGFVPTTGDSFDLINVAGGADFSSLSFQIEGLGPGFPHTDTFSNGSFTLITGNETSTTPEPNSLWLLAGALIIFPAVAWRKNSARRV
jgi:T5SS/PEP-CTERM-associated repeat protein